jgi:hypothetical protein
MKTLVAIGCSHTGGAELYDGLAHHPENKNLSFAKTIADSLGYNYINLSANGASNDYIFRTTIEFFTKNIENIHNYVFLLGWTSCNRLELHYHDNDNYETYALTQVPVTDTQYIPIVSNMFTGQILDTRIRNMVETYTDVLINQTQGADKLTNYAYVLQNLFKYHNIKYIMFNTITELYQTKSNESALKLLNLKFYLQPFESDYAFYWYCKKKLGYTELSKYGHHKKPAHDAWAHYLLNIGSHLLT